MASMLLTAAHSAAQPFNTDFYVMAATVIPVLFLAFAVQGDAYDRILRTALHLPDENYETLLSTLVYVVISVFKGVLLIAALIIVAFAGAGEIETILSIYNRSADASTGSTVLLAMLMLTCLVTAWPLVRLLAFSKSDKEASPTGPSEGSRADRNLPHGC